jgi:hypothetical protein
VLVVAAAVEVLLIAGAAVASGALVAVEALEAGAALPTGAATLEAPLYNAGPGTG